ncbi:MAG: kelch repeat-containing protein, partial [Leptolyngbyaceae cyanobacterium bins.59]|nr:kelch repeat-containing protein [Leptolyngbyaceae cyanobacterium bins.59]
SWAVDYEGNGSEVIALRGDESHTHELGRTLNSFTWKNGNTLLGTTTALQTTLGLGKHQVSLTIGDDGVPTETLTDSVAINVFPINAVGGVLTQYYSGVTLNNLSASPSFIEVVPTLRLEEKNGKIGTSPIVDNTAVVMKGKLTATTGGSYSFTTKGGSSSQIYINGTLVSGPINLAAETTYNLEARIARTASATDPIEVLTSINGGVATAINANNLTHDQSVLKPFINGISTNKGSELGGQSIALNGVAFYDGDASHQVKVHWGTQILTKPEISVEQGVIQLLTPPGTGTVAVKVETPKGFSDPVYFTYEGATTPISFTPEQAIVNAAPFAPTTAEWGPDGRLYVGAINGEITIYTFDDNYNVTNTQKVTSLTSLSNTNILGIAFNPFDSSSSPKIYVAHSQLFANGGGAFTGFSPYSGQVSVLSGSDFSIVTPLITGLPVSNHDHGVNGLAFDNNGDLLIASGGNTNAGVKHPNLGDLHESPLSAAILKAKLTDTSFNGSVKYVNTVTGVENNDQVFGDIVSVAFGVDVSVYGHGFRNPYDIAFTTQGKLFGTDNGPNGGYGAASTSGTTQSSDPTNPDELNLITEGSYYGHPNRNRGRTNDRQNVYRGPAEVTIPGVYNAPLKTVDPSTNGLTEYRSMAFGGQMRGNLLAQKWNGQLYRSNLTSDGNGIQTLNQMFGNTSGLDITTGPGGALLGIDYSDNTITLSTPIDPNVVGATAYDIFPWRAPAIGGNSFTIGGKNFGNLSNTTVTIGGKTAVLTSVSPTRIKGIIPAQAATGQLLDVSINSAGKTSFLPSAFLYLADGSTPPPSNPGTLAFSNTSFSVNENGTPGSVVTVTRIGGSNGAISATITPTNGTATAPGDFNNAPITVTFAAGDTTAKSFSIPIVNDTIAEPSETINLALTDPTGGATLGSQKTATLKIVDNDTIAPTRIEAESMSLNTYRLESLSSASGGQVITLLSGNNLESGTASFNFSGPTGTYNVILGYYDENDGVARLEVKMGNTLLNVWDLNQQLGSNLANAQTLTQKVVATGLNVTQGALFRISGTETDLEHARVDYIEFVPVASTTSAPFTTPGIWDRGPAMPVKLGEVAAGVMNGVLYMVGETSNATLAYNMATGTWRSDLAPRPFVGHHHAAEVFNGKLYLLGGLGSGAGKVQIYDPIANTWQIGADMPFAVGSSSSAVINNEIYIAGGIVSSITTNQVAKYNPTTNTWTVLASMPQGRNHAASATDGQKLYVFGGRGPGSGDANVVANGFNTVQIYNPSTNTWVSSLDSGSTLAPLPQARGGMGKAVYFNGEFYVIGGETTSGTGATAQGVYNRVDIYNPVTNTWRSGSAMPTARHGIFPILYAGEIWVAGGGQQAGFANSDVFEIL